MLPSPPFRLPPALDNAAHRVRQAARRAAEHAVEGLGLAALSAETPDQHAALQAARQALDHGLDRFCAGFDEWLDQSVARSAGLAGPLDGPAAPLDPTAGAQAPGIEAADTAAAPARADAERDPGLTVGHFASLLGQTCRWELRELDAYIAPLLGLPSADAAGNPMRADIVAQALMQGIDAMAAGAALRPLLAGHIGRALSLTLREAYTGIVAELRLAGVRPAGCVVRPPRPRIGWDTGVFTGPAATTGRAAPPLPAPAVADATAQTPVGPAATAAQPSGDGTAAPAGPAATADTHAQAADTSAAAAAPAAGPDGPDTPAPQPPPEDSGPATADPTMGQVAPHVMRVFRDLARVLTHADAVAAADAPTATSANQVRAHAHALQSLGEDAPEALALDRVAALVDQILADTEVPADVLQAIAGLQVPLMRAALGGTAFFTRRAHPVRALVNRIAALGAAASPPAEAVPGLNTDGHRLPEAAVSAVRAVLGGDFDGPEVYAQQLAALDAWAAAQAERDMAALGDAAAVVARHEAALARERQFGRRLAAPLAALPMPGYLRAFIGITWARAIVRAETDEGPDGPLSRHLRAVGRDLVMSVQPRSAPAQRQQFLQRLPQLIKDLNLGMDEARCRPEERRAFFALLLPTHAQALRSPPLSTLDFNLLVCRVEAALAPPVAEPSTAAPSADAGGIDPVMQAAADERDFSTQEAEAAGLVTESTVHWHAPPLDLDLDDPGPLAVSALRLDGLPEPEPPRPDRGAALADHLALGEAYRLHVDGRWRIVTLVHTSPSHSFFTFRCRQAPRLPFTLTYRMLRRLCDEGRLRAFERAGLVERAIARMQAGCAAAPGPSAAVPAV